MAKPIRTKVAGVTFDNDNGTSRQETIRKFCHSGDWLDVRPEPQNPHSRNAPGLWVRGGLIFRAWHKVGYVPQEDADQLRVRLDQGCRLTSRISEVVGGEDGLSYGLRIEIFVHEPPGTVSSGKKLSSASAIARKDQRPARSAVEPPSSLPEMPRR